MATPDTMASIHTRERYPAVSWTPLVKEAQSYLGSVNTPFAPGARIEI